MERYVTRGDELCHHGVKGMKWGVRKSVYKSMNRKQRKETRKKYYQTPEGRIERSAMIGTILGGPLVGAIAGLVVNKRVNSCSKAQEQKGKAFVDRYKDTKIETDEQKIKKLMAEGKIDQRANYTFDQNGNLFMVTWDD